MSETVEISEASASTDVTLRSQVYPSLAPLFSDEYCPEPADREYGLPAKLVGYADDFCPEPDSLVHTKETSDTRPEFCTYRAYTLKSCLGEFTAVRRVFEHLDDGNYNGRHHRLDECRTQAWFARDKETGDVRVFSKCCHIRWCPMCAAAKQAYITKSTSDWLNEVKHPKLLTLTILHQDLPLKEQIDNLYNWFQRLRKRKKFKDRVTGGIWFFQIKISKTDGLWHPHLHCLISGLSIYHSTIKQLWQDITYTSEIVDIRSLIDKDKAARHVARYAARPSELVNMDISKQVELIEAMHGRRLVGTWGIARSVSLKPPVVEDKSRWENLGSWSTIWGMKNLPGNACDIFNAWKNNEPLEGGINVHDTDNFINHEDFTDAARSPPQPYLTNFFRKDKNV